MLSPSLHVNLMLLSLYHLALHIASAPFHIVRIAFSEFIILASWGLMHQQLSIWYRISTKSGTEDSMSSFNAPNAATKQHVVPKQCKYHNIPDQNRTNCTRAQLCGQLLHWITDGREGRRRWGRERMTTENVQRRPMRAIISERPPAQRINIDKPARACNEVCNFGCQRTASPNTAARDVWKV